MIAAVALVAIVVFGTIVVFFITLVSLLHSSLLKRDERLWNFCVLQRLHLSILVLALLCVDFLSPSRQMLH
jgi:hypothetical protein